MKEIFATEVKLDPYNTGRKMTFLKHYIMTITQNQDYYLARDIDPNLVSTSISQGYDYPEKISNQRMLTKLGLIMELARKYKEAKDIYIRKYLRNEKSVSLGLNELNNRNIAKADKDSLPIYGNR